MDTPRTRTAEAAHAPGALVSAEERDRLVVDHVPLLRHVAGRLHVPSGVERDDLFGWGMLGLIAAADTWDPARGLRFSTYAYPKIRGAILDELRKQDFLPRGRRERVREVERAVAELEHENGEPPTPEEIAARLSTTVEEIDEVFVCARSACEVSLDAQPEDSRLGALLSDPRSDDPAGSAEWNETKALLVEAITALPEQEKTVITLYYAEQLFLREIADLLGVTESRASQVHGRALYRLNRALAGRVGTR